MIVNIYHQVPYDVYIGRKGKDQKGEFGNPIIKGQICQECQQIHQKSGETLICYERYLRNRIEFDILFRAKVADLFGKVLACFCAPKNGFQDRLICHGQILKKVAKELQGEIMTEQEFYDSIETWIQSDIKEWTHITLLAYFCWKYQQKNGVQFKLVRARKGPLMGKEAADFAKLFRTFAPENYADLSSQEKAIIRPQINLKIKNYLNWVFDYKFRSGQATINGTRLFLAPNIINDFERMYGQYLQKQKTKGKIEQLLSWCHAEASQIFDRHQLERTEDLKLIQRYADTYQLEEDSVERRVISKAIEVGLL